MRDKLILLEDLFDIVFIRFLGDFPIFHCLLLLVDVSHCFEVISSLISKRDSQVLQRRIVFYAPKIADKLKRYWHAKYSRTWYLDETYVKVKGKWHYLYRAVGTQGETIDFYLSEKRDSESARHFLSKSLRRLKKLERPKIINTDKYSAYLGPISDMQEEGILSDDFEHRRVRYLNNIIECDHGKLKRLIKPTLGFKNLHSARATITGFEVMRMFKKGQFEGIKNVREEILLVTRSL